MSRPFLKMNGLGNDFVVVEARSAPFAPTAEEVRAIADRARGVGCDQLVSIEPSQRADAAVRFWNADGEEVGACGNASRCIGWLLMEASGADQATIETPAGGLLVATRAGDRQVSVDMGEPGLDWTQIPLAEEMDTRGVELQVGPIDAPLLHTPGCVSMGNPHVVFFVPDAEAAPVREVGPLIEHHMLFPEGVNVGFAQVKARDRIRLKVWERGAGLTKACGTGACAALVAAVRRNLADRKATLELDGGELVIEWREADGHVIMTGPLELEFAGDLAVKPDSDVDIVTFGCRLNAYESEVIRARAAQDGLSNAIVFNTCAVTGEAVRQARQAIRKARRERPDAKLIVTGCAAQIDPAAFAGMAEVDLVLGNAEKSAAGAYAPSAEPARVRVNDIMSVRETAGHLIDGLKDRARAYVEVQNGCDHRCTFCIIPFGRGNSRSAAAGEVVEQVRRLAAQGYQEVVLTGVDITSWGTDLPGAPTLGQLVARILKLVPGLPRLRLSSIDAAEIDPDLMACLAAEPRLMPYLHLSLQAGDDMILKRMKRRHSRADALRLIAEVRAVRPDTAFGADLIAGFPTETEAMFKNTLALVEEAGLAFLHVFPFSPRPGTPAARMPQLSRAVVKDRAARLRAAGEAALTGHLERQGGRAVSGLVERPGVARADDFTEIAFTGEAAVGSIVPLRINGFEGAKALASLLHPSSRMEQQSCGSAGPIGADPSGEARASGSRPSASLQPG